MGIRDDLIQKIATDYQYMDGVEDLSLYRPSTGVTYTAVKAICIAAKAKEIKGTLSLKKVDKSFRVFAATLPVEPSPGDVITETDEDVTWTVVAWDRRKMKTKGIAYYVDCVRRIET